MQVRENRVLKRNGRGYEPVQFDKITNRLRRLCNGLNSVNVTRVAQETISSLTDNIRTEEIDAISARAAESLKYECPEYSVLASRILMSNLHKKTPASFAACMRQVQLATHMFSDRHYAFMVENGPALDAMIDHTADYNYDYLAYRTLEYSYLKKVPEYKLGPDGKALFRDVYGNEYTFAEVTTLPHSGYMVGSEPVNPITVDIVCDRPQYMYMRVAIAINIDAPNPLARIAKCYKSMSEKLYTHATPTLFNSCENQQQLNSCFLLGTRDSIRGIMKTVTDAAIISKSAGGIGIWQHPIRPNGQLIRGTRGKSGGLRKQLKIYDADACCWDQGGKRLGAFAIYVEPWHGDIVAFLRLKLPNGNEVDRARNLFYALWVPDLFVKRAKLGQKWSLFSEDTAPGLSDVYDGMNVCKKCGRCENHTYSKYIVTPAWNEAAPLTDEEFTRRVNVAVAAHARDAPIAAVGDTNCAHEYTGRNVFTELYEHYDQLGLATDRIDAREVLELVCTSQRETGTPYVCFKDHVNRMSNQMNIGTIKSSNLCAEIMEYSSADSYANCTLASINLPKFINYTDGIPEVDHERLHATVEEVVTSLDMIVDNTTFPVPECAINAAAYRPVAVGIQGTADLFAIMRVPFASEAASVIDLQIAETIHHAAITASVARARELGAYSAFAGSPASKGQLHPDLWMMCQTYSGGRYAGVDPRSSRYNWDELREQVRGGLRNSLTGANMPTVSTTQILGNNESFEPFPSNYYTKTTLAGKFTMVNTHMIEHLMSLGLWTQEIRLKVKNNNGSVQNISEIPEDVRELYKTIWEIPQNILMRRAAVRGAFVDQAQSLNIYLRVNSNDNLRGVFFLAHELGLKTGSYYIRTKPAATAMKTTIAETAKAISSSHKSDDHINVTVERVSADGVVRSEVKHTFQLLMRIMEDDEADALCADIAPNEEIVEMVAPPVAPSPAAAVSRYKDRQMLVERFDAAPVCNNEEGCQMCSS